MKTGGLLAAHADWSVDPRKRWITIATRTTATHTNASWQVAAPTPVGDVATLLARLRHQAGDAAILFGIDAPIGIPRAYADRHVTQPDFPTFLDSLASQPQFFQVCDDLAEISGARPFYPRRSRAGLTQAPHIAALGLPNRASLSRACDRATDERPAGATLFWTLGANQSGKAAISVWRDVLLPARAGNAGVRLWPFEGDLADLLAPATTVMAETYPAEALRHLGLSLSGSKRRQSDRAALAPALRPAMARLAAEPSPALASQIADGFGPDAAGEDQFDSTLGLLCLLNVLAGNRPGTIPPDPALRRWEGWVLGQTALPRG